MAPLMRVSVWLVVQIHVSRDKVIHVAEFVGATIYIRRLWVIARYVSCSMLNNMRWCIGIFLANEQRQIAEYRHIVHTLTNSMCPHTCILSRCIVSYVRIITTSGLERVE